MLLMIRVRENRSFSSLVIPTRHSLRWQRRTEWLVAVTWEDFWRSWGSSVILSGKGPNHKSFCACYGFSPFFLQPFFSFKMPVLVSLVSSKQLETVHRVDQLSWSWEPRGIFLLPPTFILDFHNILGNLQEEKSENCKKTTLLFINSGSFRSCFPCWCQTLMGQV